MNIDWEDILGGPAEAMGTAPGRINTVGGHTDHTEGRALAAAIDRRCTVALRRRRDATVRVAALDRSARAEAPVGTVPPGGWQAAMFGAIAVFSEDQGPVGGLEAAVAGTVPEGAGLSSSAALIVAWLVALRALQGGPPLGPAALAALARRVEHRWVGVPCGLLDPLASAAGVEGGLLAIDFRPPVAWRPLPGVLPGTAWLVLDSGTRRSLATSGYAARVAEVQAGRAALGRHWRDLSLAELAELPPLLRARLRHGITENDRVVAAVAAAQAGDAPAFGALMDASHHSLATDFAVSTPALDALAARARATPGVHGARMMGGGFGGCVVALVDAAQAAAAQAALCGWTGQRGWRLAAAGGARGWRPGDGER